MGPGVQQACVRVFCKFDQHARHRREHRAPFPDFPELVDAKPDQEDDKIAVDLCRHPRIDNSGHGAPIDLRVQRSLEIVV
jgi:hypothetical protein